MKKIIKLISITLLTTSFITSCSSFTPYTPVVQQGKIIAPNIMQQIKPGMTKDQISYILGSPDIVNALTTNIWVYAYTLQKTVNSARQEQKLVLTFDKDDKLTDISGNYQPPQAVYQTKNKVQP